MPNETAGSSRGSTLIKGGAIITVDGTRGIVLLEE